MIPDWGQVIGALPVVVVLGLVAPFLTFVVAGNDGLPGPQATGQGPLRGWARVAEIGADGQPTFPVGLPLLPSRRACLPVRHAALRALP